MEFHFGKIQMRKSHHFFLFLRSSCAGAEMIIPEVILRAVSVTFFDSSLRKNKPANKIDIK